MGDANACVHRFLIPCHRTLRLVLAARLQTSYRTSSGLGFDTCSPRLSQCKPLSETRVLKRQLTSDRSRESIASLPRVRDSSNALRCVPVRVLPVPPSLRRPHRHCYWLPAVHVRGFADKLVDNCVGAGLSATMSFLARLFTSCSSDPSSATPIVKANELKTDSATSTRVSEPSPTKAKAAPAAPAPIEPYSAARAGALFDVYEDPEEPGMIGPEQFARLCEDAGLPLDGPLPLLVSYRLTTTPMARSYMMQCSWHGRWSRRRWRRSVGRNGWRVRAYCGTSFQAPVSPLDY
jgi:hypothetical protein